jgi:hypothetical protein
MPVLRGFPIKIEMEEVLRRQSLRDPKPAVVATAQWAIARALELAEPQVAYTVLKSEGVKGEELWLEGGGRLRMGPHADLAAEAQEVYLEVHTIGPKLEAEARALMAGDEPLRGYLLDCAGVVAVGQAGARIRSLIEETANAKGWGVSPSLYPGSPMGWPTRGQRDLLPLIPAPEVGVTLTSSYMLVPQKSSTTLVGIGPGYDNSEVGALCDWCGLRDSCWRRKTALGEAANS